MALIKCPECGKEISNTCDNCVHCGYKLTEKDKAVNLSKVNETNSKNRFAKEKNKSLIVKWRNELICSITSLVLSIGCFIWFNFADDDSASIQIILIIASYAFLVVGLIGTILSSIRLAKLRKDLNK